MGTDDLPQGYWVCLLALIIFLVHGYCVWSWALIIFLIGIQFGTQVKFCWSCDRNDRTAENAFSAPCFFSEMGLEPAAS